MSRRRLEIIQNSSGTTPISFQRRRISGGVGENLLNSYISTNIRPRQSLSNSQLFRGVSAPYETLSACLDNNEHHINHERGFLCENSLEKGSFFCLKGAFAGSHLAAMTSRGRAPAFFDDGNGRGWFTFPLDEHIAPCIP